MIANFRKIAVNCQGVTIDAGTVDNTLIIGYADNSIFYVYYEFTKE